MTSTQNTSPGAVSGSPAVHLLLVKGDAKLMANDPQQVMADIHLRATKMTSVLQHILRESHGKPRRISKR